MNACFRILAFSILASYHSATAFAPSSFVAIRPQQITRVRALSRDQVAELHDSKMRTLLLKDSKENSFNRNAMHPLAQAVEQVQIPQAQQERISSEQQEAQVATVRLMRGLADAMYSPAEAVVEKRLCHFFEEVVEHQVERQACSLAWHRVATTVMALLPLLGAAFVLYLANHDVHRAKHEWKHCVKVPLHMASPSTNLHGRMHKPATMIAVGLFLAAGLADVLDALLHIFVSHQIFTMHVMDPTVLHNADPSSALHPMDPALLHPHVDQSVLHHEAPQDGQDFDLATLEEWSSKCVLTSAMCVALGEMVSFVNNDEHQENQHHQVEMRNNDMHRGASPHGLPQAL